MRLLTICCNPWVNVPRFSQVREVKRVQLDAALKDLLKHQYVDGGLCNIQDLIGDNGYSGYSDIICIKVIDEVYHFQEV